MPTLVALGLGQIEAQATSLLAILPTVAVGAANQRRYGNLRVRTALVVGARVGARGRGRAPGSRPRSPRPPSGGSSPRCSSRSRCSSSGGPPVTDRATLTRRDPCRRPRQRGAGRGRRPRRRRSTATGRRAPARTRCCVRITIPGQETVSLGELTWPTNLSADVQSFQFPDDGSIVSLGRSRALVSAQTGEAATAQAVGRGGRALALRRRGRRRSGGGVDHRRSESALGRGRRVGLRGSRAACARTGRLGGPGLDRVARGLGCRLGSLACRAAAAARSHPARRAPSSRSA